MISNLRPPYVRYVYTSTHIVKSYTVYELTSKLGFEKSFLTDVIRIEKDRGFSKSKNIDERLTLRDSTNWSNCTQITGLKFTPDQSLFFGDYNPLKRYNANKDLLIFKYSNDKTKLIIDHYKGFYPDDKYKLISILKTY